MNSNFALQKERKSKKVKIFSKSDNLGEPDQNLRAMYPNILECIPKYPAACYK